MQNFKPLFPIILPIFDLECHGQASLKIAFVTFRLAFMKFRKLKSLDLENKNLIAIKLSIFIAKIIPYSLGQKLFLKSYSEFLMTSSDWMKGSNVTVKKNHKALF